MVSRAWAALALVPAALLVQAESKAPKQVRASFLGEGGGGFRTPTGGAGDYLENRGRINHETSEGDSAAAPVVAPAAKAPAAPPKAQPIAKAAAASLDRIGAFVPRDPASRRYASSQRKPAPQASPQAPAALDGYALWESLSAPVEMSAAKVAQSGLDEAERGSRQEYERRILGALRRPQPQAETPAPAKAPNSSAAGELFVAVDLAARDSGGLKDAVAGLSRIGLRLEESAPGGLAVGGSAAHVRGWLPAGQLSAAARAPGVRRVEVARGSGAPDRQSPAATSLVVGLRIPSRGSAALSVQKTIGELSSSARFIWRRTIGFEAIPHSSDVALVVVGELPVASLSRLLEHPDVLKIAPAPAELASGPAPAARPRAARVVLFLAYVRRHAPLLLLVTLVLLLPTAVEWLSRLGRALSR